jgi:hypothetical protein
MRQEPIRVFEFFDAWASTWELPSTDPRAPVWPLMRFAREAGLARALAPDLARALDFAFVHTRVLDLVDAAFGQSVYSSTLQEGFWPDLSHSFPMFNCFHLRGRIGDAMLIGPGLVEFDLERDGRTVHPVDLEGRYPEEVTRSGYDLVFPMTAVPLGELRRQCPEWRSDREYRSLGVVPFLAPDAAECWSRQSQRLLQLFKVDRIFALLPRIEFWSKPFAEWTDEDWKTSGLSALWDIRFGRVLWAKGAHHVDEMQSIGKPIEEFLKEHGSRD